MYLTNTNAISVTIGAGGPKCAWNTIASGEGGQSVFNGSSAGGIALTSVGGIIWSNNFTDFNNAMLSPGFGASYNSSASGSPGPGVNGYGMGGGVMTGGLGGYTSSKKPNSGQGGGTGNNTSRSTDGASGYCLIKWYE